MDTITHVVNQVLPILLLLALGALLRRTRLLSPEMVEGLKALVLTLGLPAVLFLSFLKVEFQANFFALFLATFGLCVGLLLLGRLLRPALHEHREYVPFLLSGFEYGMIGVSLFGSVYGLDAVGYIAVVDLGHEFYIWFALAPLLIIKRDGAGNPGAVLGMIVKTPVILAILLGIGLNLAGVGPALPGLPVVGGVVRTLDFLSRLTIPLILIIVGWGIHFEREGLRDVVVLVALRTAILVPLALVLNRVLISGLLSLGPAYEAAFFTLLILPSPFIIPLFIPAERAADRRFVNNVLTLHSLTSIAVFTVYVAAHPTL